MQTQRSRLMLQVVLTDKAMLTSKLDKLPHPKKHVSVAPISTVSRHFCGCSCGRGEASKNGSKILRNSITGRLDQKISGTISFVIWGDKACLHRIILPVFITV